MTGTPAVTANDLLTTAQEAEQQAAYFTDMAKRYRHAAAIVNRGADADLTDGQAEVLALLNGTPRRLTDLAREAQRSQPATYSLIKGLVKAKRVRRVQRGLYERCH